MNSHKLSVTCILNKEGQIAVFIAALEHCMSWQTMDIKILTSLIFNFNSNQGNFECMKSLSPQWSTMTPRKSLFDSLKLHHA